MTTKQVVSLSNLKMIELSSSVNRAKNKRNITLSHQYVFKIRLLIYSGE